LCIVVAVTTEVVRHKIEKNKKEIINEKIND